MQYSRIVINEPHASIEGLYDERLSFWNIDERFVNVAAGRSTSGLSDSLIRASSLTQSVCGTTRWRLRVRESCTSCLMAIRA